MTLARKKINIFNKQTENEEEEKGRNGKEIADDDGKQKDVLLQQEEAVSKKNGDANFGEVESGFCEVKSEFSEKIWFDYFAFWK